MFLLGQQQTLCRALSIWGRAGYAFPLLLAPTMRKPRPGNELKGDELVLVRQPERLEARPRQAVSFGQASLSPGRAAGGPGAWLQRRPPCSQRGQRCPADVRVPGGRSVPLAAQHAFYFVLALALFAPLLTSAASCCLELGAPSPYHQRLPQALTWSLIHAAGSLSSDLTWCFLLRVF